MRRLRVGRVHHLHIDARVSGACGIWTSLNGIPVALLAVFVWSHGVEASELLSRTGFFDEGEHLFPSICLLCYH
jgi:hypothetical protein